MEKVTGIGGVFFKSEDPKTLAAWYAEHLGVPVLEWGGAAFQWHPMDEPERTAATIWSPFPADTNHFDPSPKPYMVNYRVADLDAMLAQLRAAGVQVDDKVDDSEYGRFGWAMDPEGNRIELWQPPAGA